MAPADQVVLRRSPGVHTSRVRGRYVAVDARSGELFELRGDVAAILELADGTATIAQLARELGEVDDAPVDVLRDRLLDVAGALHHLGLVRLDPSS